MNAITYQKILATNSNASSFASVIPQIAEPSGDGVFDLFAYGGRIKWVKLLPYGLGSANDAFSMRLIGWSPVLGRASLVNLWVPSIITELAVVMGQAVGVATAPVLNTEAFADTITMVYQPKTLNDITTSGNINNGKVIIHSPVNDTVAYAVAPVYGFRKISFSWDQTTNTPTMNGLMALLEDCVE